MKFMFSIERPILIGWSAKCGCTHIKNIIHYLNDNETDDIHITQNTDLSLIDNIDIFLIILIIRNPYERLVSGFRNIYKNKNGKIRNKWNDNKNIKLTFNNFVNELVTNNFETIDEHHFIQQTEESFNYDIITNHKHLAIFDINNIDYKFLEHVFQKDIPKEKIDYRGPHFYNPSKEKIEDFVYDLCIDDICDNDIDYRYFYNEEIKNKVYEFYKNDFEFFKKYNINYEFELFN